MDDVKSCLFCYRLDGKGGGVKVDIATVNADGTAGDHGSGPIWIYLNANHADTRKFLRDRLQLAPLIIKTMLANITRPRYEDVNGNALVILRGINFNPGPKPEDLVSLRLWITDQLIITISRRKSRAVAEIDTRVTQGLGPSGPGDFLTMLLDTLSDSIEPALQELDDKLTTLEDQSLDNPDEKLREHIAGVRKEATVFRRHLSPQRDVLGRLQHVEKPWISTTDRWNFQDNIDRITRFIEDLDSLRERAEILHDELSNALGAKLNRNLYVLSVITVIFMPLSFITGLLGMNVKGIPDADNPHAFLAVCGLSVAITIFQVWLFRRLKWF